MENRGRGRGLGAPRKPHSKNRQWVAGHENGGGPSSDSDRWERGGHRRGRGRGRGYHSHPTHLSVSEHHDDGLSGTEDEEQDTMDEGVEDVVVDKEPESQEDRDKFFKELLKARELERKSAIAEGKMTDPTKPVSLDEAITLVGTCQDMCPMFERYRREREHNLSPWEVISGTKRVDHTRAVKMYERGAGDKSLPSDLRPPLVLKRTLDYLFHDLIPRGGFSETWSFVRDRSRQVRNDFTIQHESGPIAIECHDRCARFHILALHFERKNPGFSVAMEDQMLMHVLLSLIQFYGDQRGKYASPTELEMRVYHRLIHIRDQRTRNEEVPEEIENHPVFKLTTQFRRHVQDKSVPITKTSKLVVDAEAMEIFGRLASVLREQNNVIMIYLVACIMERLFGDDTIEDIESIRGGLEIPQIIDGIAMPTTITSPPNNSPTAIEQRTEAESVQAPLSRSATEWLTNNFGAQPPVSTFGVPSSATPQPTLPLPTNPPIVKSAFSNLTTTPSAFGSSNVFGGPVFGQNVKSVFNTSVSTQKPSLAGPSSVPSQPSTSITTSSNLIVAPSVFSSSPLNNLSPSLSQASPPNQKVPAMSSRSSQSSVQPIAIPTHLNPQATEFIPQDLPLPPTPLRPVQAVQPSIPISNGQLRPTLKISPHSVPAEPFPCPNILQEDPGPSMDTSNLEATFTLTPFPEHPKPRIVERRQTLWEIPGTPPVTPPARTPAPALTQNEPMSPREPPPLGKVQPVSLPPTPTARWFDPSSLPKLPDSSLLRKKSLLGFPNLQFSAPTPAEILSPLQIPSPGSLRAPIFNTGSPSPATRTQAGSAAPPISPTKLPRVVEESSSHAKAETEVTPKQLRELAVSFRSGQLQKKCFSRWLEKATDRAAYAEACARSEVYRERVQHQRLSGSTGNTTPNKKRRISLGSSVSSSHGKRTRIRRSGEYRPPQTDETLVKRLKENQEENQRRWARGTFLRTIQSRLRRSSPEESYPPNWRIWVSTNAENDNTAIWLEQKLDIPGVGRWASKSVFSIPLDPNSGPSIVESPGLILIERTPLGDVEDPIERKYRVLDDCARLRDIVDALRSNLKRLRYLPILLVVSWSESEVDDEFLDFAEMAKYLIEEGLVKAVSRFQVSSTAVDLDKEFETLLGALDLDIEDRNSQTLSWADLAGVYTKTLRQTAADWLYSCWVGGHFDWDRYADVLRVIRESQVVVANELLSILHVPSEIEALIPVDLEEPAQLGLDYAMGQFLDVHVKLPIATVEQHLGNTLQPSYTFDRDDIQASVHRIETSLTASNTRLRELTAIAALATPPSKRRFAAEDPRFKSPASASKRPRASLSAATSEDDVMFTEGSQTNGVPTSPVPSTVGSTVGISEAPSKPIITVAMLRALTREVLSSI